jgi:histidinol phosphatase-like enzyme
MLLQASRELNLDLDRSWMIGDILDDVEAGHRAGCRAVLLDSGAETCWVPGPLRVPDYTVLTLPEAARRILAADAATPACAGTSWESPS